MSSEAFIALHDLPRSRFHAWRLKLRGPASFTSRSTSQHLPQLVPVHVDHTAARPTAVPEFGPKGDRSGAHAWEFVSSDGHALRVHGSVEPEVLQTLLATLTGSSKVWGAR